MNKGISFHPLCGLLIFSKAEVWDGPFDGRSPWGPFMQEWDLPPLRYIIFDHFMRESKYENHMFKVQSALRTSAALEFGEPARISKTIK